MKPSYIGEAVNFISYLVVSVQDNELFAYIQLGLNVLTTLVLLAFRIWAWVRDAKEDGKITKDEIKEGGEIIGDALEDLKDTFEGEKDDGEVH